MKKILVILLLSVAIFALTDCEKHENITPYNNRNDNGQNNVDYTTYDFVWKMFYTYYYWNKNIPLIPDYSKYTSPYDMFLDYKEPSDRFSAILNNYSDLFSSFNNEYVTDGISYDLFRNKYDTETIIAVVKYVYNDSPGEAAGIKRGYVINAVNGTKLTDNNYSSLLNLNQYTLTYTILELTNEENSKFKYDGQEYTSPLITKTKLKINPVQKVATYNIDGHNIGYLLFNSFDDEASTIIQAIKQLQQENITDLVVDLRFNGGGYINTLDTLASMMVPAGYEGKLFIKNDMNDNLLAAYKREKIEPNLYFSPMDTHLNINKLCVLTSKNTASASEELISGLDPYLDVVIIGDTTYGKYTTNYLLNNQDAVGKDSDGIDYSEWAVYLVIGLCKNSLDQMNFQNGFAPNYYIEETFVEPLGNTQEPLFAKAIEVITGNNNNPALAKRGKKSTTKEFEYIGSIDKPFGINGLIMQGL